MTFQGTVRGKSIELESLLPFPGGKEVTIELVETKNGAPVGSPRALLSAIRQAPHIDSAIVDDLERAIQAGRITVRNEGSC